MLALDYRLAIGDMQGQVYVGDMARVRLFAAAGGEDRHDLLASAGTAALRAGIMSLAWWPVDTALFASGDARGGIVIWDAEAVRPVARVSVPAPVYHLAFPDPTAGAFHLAQAKLTHQHGARTEAPILSMLGIACGSTDLHVLSTFTPSVVRTFAGHSAAIQTLAWSPSYV